MRTHSSFSILAAGILALACGGLSDKAAPPRTGTASLPGAGTTGEAAPEAAAPEAPASAPVEESADFAAEGGSAPAPTAAHAGASPTRSLDASEAAPRARAEAKKSSRPLDIEPERPGLGTTWGETMSSHVSNAPFDRASSNPFSITSLHYNDQRGVSAMLRGADFADFRSQGMPLGQGMLTVRVTDGSGVPLPTFAGHGRTLVQGEIGQRYMIQIENRSSDRFEAVVTVDGLDVIDGRPGSLSKRGYLVHPFATVQIDGFRQNMDQVAAFRFGSVRGSYAAGKGGDRNVGVIGVALFAERGARHPWTEREISRRESADPFPGRFASPPIAR